MYVADLSYVKMYKGKEEGLSERNSEKERCYYKYVSHVSTQLDSHTPYMH